MSNTMIMLLAYIGPETMLPLASVLAAAMGLVLMFWRYIFQLIRRMFGAIFCRKQKKADAKTAVPINPKANKPKSDGTVLQNKADPAPIVRQHGSNP